ncbi:MAG: cache domain-containing protein [Pseudomonadota bacterium]
MRWSLGAILAICLAGLQFVAIVIVVLSSYVTSERALLNHASNLLSDVAISAMEHSKGFLEPARGAAELSTRLAENRIVTGENTQLLEKLLFQQLTNASQFAGLYYGDQAGNFVYVMTTDAPGPFRTKKVRRQGEERETELIWRNSDFAIVEVSADPGDTYDPRTRPWYLDATQRQDTIWTDPYIFYSSQTPGITVASPVVNADGSLDGVIGVDIEISAISEFLARLKIGENGKALILNRNGDVIAHPNQDLLKIEDNDGSLRFPGIDEIEDPIARAAFGSLNDGALLSVADEVAGQFDFEGKGYVSITMPVISAELPWTIAIYAPENDFTSVIKANRTRNLWIAAGIAVLTGLIGITLAEQIHRPVRAFAVRSALISQGEISPDASPPRTYKELEVVNQTLVDEIAQRKKTEREYGRTFDLAPQGMAQIEPHTSKITRANAKLADVLGYELEELVGLAVTDVIHPEDIGPLHLFPDVPATSAPIVNERRLVRKDGSVVWIHASSIMIRDDDGQLLHAVVTIEDVTESKQAEAQIEKLEREMSHVARVNLMGQMAAGLAHELNQPLTAITQNIDVARLTVNELAAQDEELLQSLEAADEQAHRAAEIIRALRSFVRKDTGERSHFDFYELLEQTLRLLRTEATDSGVRIFYKTSPLPQVVGNRVQIAQVLVNLLRNAIEAVAMSGNNCRKINVTAQQTDRSVEICVADSGNGVDPAIDLFTQFETTKSDGMGLGLTISRSIVEAHGGRMWYGSTESWKSAFFFTLPVVEKTDAKPEQTMASS